MNELRSKLSIIQQEDGILFCSTVRENLDPNSRYSEKEIWKCLETVHLKELISSSFPQKLGKLRTKNVLHSIDFFLSLDTCFSESGALLSFGQRQLFVLARAVLKESSILVLDEATSNLDYETELLFLKAANDAFRGRTIITIAVSETVIKLHCKLNFISNLASFIFFNGLRSSGNYGEWKNNRRWKSKSIESKCVEHFYLNAQRE